jgi:hypothetical protein
MRPGRTFLPSKEETRAEQREMEEGRRASEHYFHTGDPCPKMGQTALRDSFRRLLHHRQLAQVQRPAAKEWNTESAPVQELPYLFGPRAQKELWGLLVSPANPAFTEKKWTPLASRSL